MSDKENIPTIEEQMQMAMEADRISKHTPRQIEIQGKTYTLHPISNRIDANIAGLAFDALRYEQEIKAEGCSARKMKRLNREMRKIPAKIAAYYKLGRKALWIPFLYAVTWRILWNKSEAVSATINAACATGDDKDFFLANSEVIKYLLALSMRGVGESVRQMLERKESAASMLDEDASPKKEEGSKSAARSSKAPKTRR